MQQKINIVNKFVLNALVAEVNSCSKLHLRKFTEIYG